MKKKFLVCLVCLCLIICGTLFLTACEKFNIEERDYQLVKMFVVKDNTPNGDYYVNYTEGAFTESFTGKMHLSDCIITIGKESSTLKFDDSKNTGLSAEYFFEINKKNSDYPTYDLSSIKFYLNGVDISDYKEEQFSNLTYAQKDLLIDILQFNYVLQYGNTSFQLISQNKDFCCQITIVDKNSDNLIFKGLIYSNKNI